MVTDKFDFGPEETRGQEPFYPPSVDFEEAVNAVLNKRLAEKVFDVIWNVYFHEFSFYESGDGFDQTLGASGSITVNGGVVVLATGTTSGTKVIFRKNPQDQTILRWDRWQRFKVSFSALHITDIEARIGIGDMSGTSIDTHYGFRLNGATLQGTASVGTSETQVTLLTISAATGYDLEARFIPGDKVVFLVDGAERGVITTNLPNGDASPTHTEYVHIWVKNSAASTKNIRTSHYEFIQRK